MRNSIFNVSLRTHHNAAAPRLIGTFDALHTHDVATGREIRRLHIVHESFNVNIRVVNIRNTPVNHFSQVMGRNIRCHADSDTARTINQKVRNARRHNRRFLKRVVKVRHHVHSFLFDILHHGLADEAESGFRVTHGRSRVAVHRAEVALPVHERTTHVPILCHTHQCAVNRTVSMWVILTEHLTDNTGRLTRGLVMRISQTKHTIQYAPVNRFKPVTYVRQSSCHDYRHGVVYIGGFHFLLNIHFDYLVFFCHYIYIELFVRLSPVAKLRN